MPPFTFAMNLFECRGCMRPPLWHSCNIKWSHRMMTVFHPHIVEVNPIIMKQFPHTAMSIPPSHIQSHMNEREFL